MQRQEVRKFAFKEVQSFVILEKALHQYYKSDKTWQTHLNNTGQFFTSKPLEVKSANLLVGRVLQNRKP